MSPPAVFDFKSSLNKPPHINSITKRKHCSIWSNPFFISLKRV